MEQIHEDLLQKLIQNREAVAVSQDIEDMNEKGRSPQLRYVYDLLRRLKMLPDGNKWIESKSDKKAEEFRNKGNSLYASNQFLAAIEMYNQSLCYAETDGDLYHLSVGFANRSAVFFKLKMYQECLDSIRLAKEHNYPDQLLHKLQKRESNCTEMINRNRKNEPKNIITNFRPKLSYPANKKVREGHSKCIIRILANYPSCPSTGPLHHRCVKVSRHRGLGSPCNNGEEVECR